MSGISFGGSSLISQLTIPDVSMAHCVHSLDYHTTEEPSQKWLQYVSSAESPSGAAFMFNGHSLQQCTSVVSRHLLLIHSYRLTLEYSLQLGMQLNKMQLGIV